LNKRRLKAQNGPIFWPPPGYTCAPTALSRFTNVLFRHHWHYAMQKNVSSIEFEQRNLCRVLHFNRQNLMLINPPND